MYIFGAPGWSHDNSTLTVKEMQLNAKKEKMVTETKQQKTQQPELVSSEV